MSNGKVNIIYSKSRKSQDIWHVLKGRTSPRGQVLCRAFRLRATHHGKTSAGARGIRDGLPMAACPSRVPASSYTRSRTLGTTSRLSIDALAYGNTAKARGQGHVLPRSVHLPHALAFGHQVIAAKIATRQRKHTPRGQLVACDGEITCPCNWRRRSSFACLASSFLCTFR